MPRSSHDLHIACLFDAIRTLNERAVTTLMDLYNLDVNDNSSFEEYFGTPMHVAAETNDVRMVRLIHSLGGEVDGKDYYGDTPLYSSMMHGRTLSASVLLELGADLYAEVMLFDREKDTPLIETPLSVCKKRNNDAPYPFVVPYTKEFKRMKKLRLYTKVVGTIMSQYQRSIHNVWKPGGVGYMRAQDNFHHMIKN